MKKNEVTICGKNIQHDNSGVGHNWRTIDASDIPADIRDDIAAEMIEGKKNKSAKYIAANGLWYRW